MWINNFLLKIVTVCCRNTLATRLQEVERRKLDESSQRQLEKERADDIMQKMKEAKDTAEKDAAIAR